MRIHAIALATLLLAGTAGACDLRIETAWIRTPPPQATTLAGYATLVNTGKAERRVVAAQSTLADRVMLHATQMHGGMAMMRDMPEIRVPAGSKVELAPGGMHLMLMGPKSALRAGDHVTITLVDDTGCRVNGDFSVQTR